MPYNPTYVDLVTPADSNFICFQKINDNFESINSTLGEMVALVSGGFAYTRIALIGGNPGCLDNIDGDRLSDGDTAVVIAGNNPARVYFYVLDEDKNTAENSPYIITPDTNAGSKRWVLAARVPRTWIGSGAPTANDDYNDGVSVGDWWLYNNDAWICVTETVGAAVWRLALQIGTGSTNAAAGDHSHSGASQIPSTSISDWAEAVQDTAGAMFSSNTETGLSLAYDDASGKINASVSYGTTSSTACQGNDSRLSDSRSPTSHTHAQADLTDATATKTASKIPIADGSGYLNTWIETGDTSGTICAGDDARLSDARTPTSHNHATADLTDATDTPTASKIPIADNSGKLDGWVTYGSAETIQDTVGAMVADNTESTVNLAYDHDNGKISVYPLYPPNWYWASSRFQAKPVAAGADRTILLSPDFMQVVINGSSYTLTSQVTLSLTIESTWDTISGTDYRELTNRIGKDFFVYACEPVSGTVPVLKVSANATYPSGYTASNSRMVAGFHTLCGTVGTINAHWLSGYLTGDILPYSVWSLNWHPISSPLGMVYSPHVNIWVDIYLPSGTGFNTKSVYHGDVSFLRDYNDFVDDGWLNKKRLLTDWEFQAIAAQSNEQTILNHTLDPDITGGNQDDTTGRRMISLIGVEDACGMRHQWLSESAIQTSLGGSWGWRNVLSGSKGYMYLIGDSAESVLAAGGAFYEYDGVGGAYAGSRCRIWGHCRWHTQRGISTRFASEHSTDFMMFTL